MKPLDALRALGTGGEAPAPAKERVYDALLASLEGATAPMARGPAANFGSSATPPTLNAKLWALGTAIWVVGGITGAFLYGALRPPAARLVYVERPQAVNLPPMPSFTAQPSAPPQPSVQPPHLLPPATPSRALGSNDASARLPSASQLAQERALLDLARRAASRGEPAAALTLAEQHGASFPRGQLSEEREALAIRALLALGQRDRARARADAFRSRFPSSFLGSMLESAFANP